MQTTANIRRKRAAARLMAFCVACAAAVPGSAGAGDAEVLGFADHLFGQRDYYRAITEYERFVYLFPTNPLAGRAGFSAALCYCNGGKFEAAIPVLRSVREKFPASEEAREAGLVLAEIQYRLRNYSSAISAVTDAIGEKSDPDRMGRGLILSGLCRLRLGDSEGAIEAARRASADQGRRHDAGVLERAATSLPGDEKSPLFAGALSAVIPGAGQLYVGRPRDAALAFALNGILIAGIVAAFHNDEPVAGAALSIVELAWYSGNVYGAVNAAHKRNAMSLQRFFGELEFRLNILSAWTANGPSVKPAAGVGLRF
jgi:hypothetical protein